GLASPAQLHAALAAHHTHLLGLGRAAVLRPDLPRLLKTQLADDAAAQHPFAPRRTCASGARGHGAHVPSAYQAAGRWRLDGVVRRDAAAPSYAIPCGCGWALRADYSVGALGGILWMWAWFGPEFAGNSMKGHALAALLSVLFVGACFSAHM
ncbi:hypothetical protein B0H10DRAFT_2212992, partial [Mycena sp. CBHHK59/15]